jgi:hypothetical protein
MPGRYGFFACILNTGTQGVLLSVRQTDLRLVLETAVELGSPHRRASHGARTVAWAWSPYMHKRGRTGSTIFAVGAEPFCE